MKPRGRRSVPTVRQAREQHRVDREQAQAIAARARVVDIPFAEAPVQPDWLLLVLVVLAIFVAAGMVHGLLRDLR